MRTRYKGMESTSMFFTVDIYEQDIRSVQQFTLTQCVLASPESTTWVLYSINNWRRSQPKYLFSSKVLVQSLQNRVKSESPLNDVKMNQYEFNMNS